MGKLFVFALIGIAGLGATLSTIARNRAVSRAVGLAEQGGPFGDVVFHAPRLLAVLALCCFGFAGWLAFDMSNAPNIKKEEGSALVLAMVASIPALVGLLLLITYFRKKVVVEGDEVRIHGAFGAKTFALSQVVGLDVGERGHAMVNLTTGKDVFLSLGYRRIDLLLAKLLRHRPSGGTPLS